MQIDYSTITESPGLKATKEQAERIFQRYHFAKSFADNKAVLEVACGSGIGLGYLAQTAKTIFGGDLDEKNLIAAQSYYSKKSDKVNLGFIDAHYLPFSDKSFNLLLLYEALYYLQNPEQFVLEANRVLEQDGKIIICTVNKAWEDFHPSPYTHKYFTVPELYNLLKTGFGNIKLYGAFPVAKDSMKHEIFSFIKQTAVKLDLIPGSLKTRVYLKRIFMGKLIPLPDEIYDNMAPYEAPVEIDIKNNNKNFTIIYAVATK